MPTQATRQRIGTFLVGAAALVFSAWALADPPSRVARLGYTSGAVSFSPAGESDWVQATLNRPLGTGDRLWSDARARAEIQVGGAMIRMSAHTSVSVLNLDDRITQLQLTQGTLNVRLRRLEAGQEFEVDTPNLAFVLRQPGDYRIDVDPDSDATTIVVRKGQGEVYGDEASFVIDARQPYRFTGTDLREHRLVDAPRLDEFDRWASDRDRAFDTSRSARYVSPDVVGYQDLDANGTWRNDATYGSVWIPNRVEAGWAPFRDGHWAWIDPWGWTWVDDAPWGYAVSHYGRWANFGGTWGWVPGPVRSPAYYAPALVVFVGGSNFQLTISSGNVGGVAWFPLAPREVYRPSYPVSRGYFENVNRSNTVVNNTVVNNVYNNVNVTNIVYANRQVAGAVVAVPTTAFVQSQAVSKAAVRVSPDMVVSQPVAIAPSVAPTQKSVHGAAPQADRPLARALERPVVARTAPPAAHPGFAAQQPKLSAKPGTPLDEAERKDLRPAAAAASQAPMVKVLAQRPAAKTTAPGADTEPGKKPAPKDKDAAASQAAPPTRAVQTPAAKTTDPSADAEPGKKPTPKDAAASQAAPPTRAERAADPRATTERRGAGGQRRQPADVAEPAESPQVAVPRPPPATAVQRKSAARPPSASSAPVADPPQPRMRPGPAPTAKQVDPRPSVAAARPLPPQSEPVPKAEQRASEPGPAASRPGDNRKDRDPKKQDEEDRKPKG